MGRLRSGKLLILVPLAALAVGCSAAATPTASPEPQMATMDRALAEFIVTYWDDHYAALQRHADREGHALPPLDHQEEGLSLGQRVGQQRRTYGTMAESRTFRSSQTQERVRRLEALAGWSWQAPE